MTNAETAHSGENTRVLYLALELGGVAGNWVLRQGWKGGRGSGR